MTWRRIYAIILFWVRNLSRDWNLKLNSSVQERNELVILERAFCGRLSRLSRECTLPQGHKRKDGLAVRHPSSPQKNPCYPLCYHDDSAGLDFPTYIDCTFGADAITTIYNLINVQVSRKFPQFQFNVTVCNVWVTGRWERWGREGWQGRRIGVVRDVIYFQYGWHSRWLLGCVNSHPWQSEVDRTRHHAT